MFLDFLTKKASIKSKAVYGNKSLQTNIQKQEWREKDASKS